MKTKKINILKVKTSKNKKKIKNNKKTQKSIKNKIKMKAGALEMSIMTTPFNIPSQSYPLKKSEEDIKKYFKIMCANKFDTASIRIFKQLLEKTTHITFKHLINSIKKTIKKFEDQINGEKFYLYLPITVDNTPIENKSNYWMSKIFYLLMNTKPIEIITSFQELTDEMKDIIVCDDAIYSGLQMYYIFTKLQNYNIPKDKHTFHILCPFISQVGINILNSNEKFNKNFYYDEILIPFREYVGVNNTDTEFKRKVQMLFSQPLDKDAYPYYFDHRVADGMSSFPQLYELGKVCKDTPQYKCIYLNSLLENCTHTNLPVGTNPLEFMQKCPPIPYRPGIIGFKEGLKEGQYTPGIKEVTPEEFLREFNGE